MEGGPFGGLACGYRLGCLQRRQRREQQDSEKNEARFYGLLFGGLHRSSNLRRNTGGGAMLWALKRRSIINLPVPVSIPNRRYHPMCHVIISSNVQYASFARSFCRPTFVHPTCLDGRRSGQGKARQSANLASQPRVPFSKNRAIQSPNLLASLNLLEIRIRSVGFAWRANVRNRTSCTACRLPDYAPSVHRHAECFMVPPLWRPALRLRPRPLPGLPTDNHPDSTTLRPLGEAAPHAGQRPLAARANVTTPRRATRPGIGARLGVRNGRGGPVRNASVPSGALTVRVQIIPLSPFFLTRVGRKTPPFYGKVYSTP